VPDGFHTVGLEGADGVGTPGALERSSLRGALSGLAAAVAVVPGEAWVVVGRALVGAIAAVSLAPARLSPSVVEGDRSATTTRRRSTAAIPPPAAIFFLGGQARTAARKLCPGPPLAQCPAVSRALGDAVSVPAISCVPSERDCVPAL
jgi:hypothetical protein